MIKKLQRYSIDYGFADCKDDYGDYCNSVEVEAIENTASELLASNKRKDATIEVLTNWLHNCQELMGLTATKQDIDRMANLHALELVEEDEIAQFEALKTYPDKAEGRDNG